VNRQIGRVAAITLVLFAALFVNLNVITLIQADDLANHPANRRLIIREYGIERGPIVVGETAIARSEETEGQYRYLRTYPEGELYAHLTGYYSVVLQRYGLEAALNEDLTGRSTEVLAQNLGELLGASDRAGNVVELTIDPRAQRAARDGLAGRVGAVVALDPTTGAILAQYSNPTFDPNPLSSHDPRAIADAWEPLREDPSRPLVDRSIAETYPPGSTFKLVVAAAALEEGLAPSTEFPDPVTFDVPQTTADIGNFGGGVCADGVSIDLLDAMRVSCNTVFAQLGVELGVEVVHTQAERFGFNQRIPYELTVASSSMPDELDVPATAQSAIGQRDVRATPLQMAMVAASIANGGQLMRPHVVASVRDPSGRRLRGADIGRWTGPPGNGEPISSRTAQQLRDMMLAVVGSGTGRAARIDGVEVGGKTGTAQTGGTPIAWFVGFADQRVAVAVVLPDAGADATGGALAAPIAREVMAAVLRGAG
jgi:penicillin-binding protein A